MGTGGFIFSFFCLFHLLTTPLSLFSGAEQLQNVRNFPSFGFTFLFIYISPALQFQQYVLTDKWSDAFPILRFCSVSVHLPLKDVC